MVNKRFKIIFYFLSGIGLPSILLGYLAFRGIMNDRALVEKELLNRCSEIAANVEQSFDDHYRLFASDLYQYFIPEIEKNPRYFASIQSQYPLIDALFIINRSGDIQFPFQKLLYICDGNSHKLSEISPDSRSSVFQKGQEYEFVHQKYEDALQFYQIAYNQNDEPHIKAGILNAICRIRKKSCQWDEAIQSQGAPGPHQGPS